MGPALQGIFVGQGPRALPGVRGKTGRRGEGTPPYGGVAGKCLRGSRADRGVRPYGWFARSLWGGRPRGSPLRTGTRSACVDRGRGRTPPLRSAWQGVPAWIAGGQRRPPLRMVCKKSVGRATARVAPTDGYKKCLRGSRAGQNPAPYGGVARSACVESPSQLR